MGGVGTGPPLAGQHVAPAAQRLGHEEEVQHAAADVPRVVARRPARRRGEQRPGVGQQPAVRPVGTDHRARGIMEAIVDVEDVLHAADEGRVGGRGRATPLARVRLAVVVLVVRQTVLLETAATVSGHARWPTSRRGRRPSRSGPRRRGAPPAARPAFARGLGPAACAPASRPAPPPRNGAARAGRCLGARRALPRSPRPTGRGRPRREEDPGAGRRGGDPRADEGEEVGAPVVGDGEAGRVRYGGASWATRRVRRRAQHGPCHPRSSRDGPLCRTPRASGKPNGRAAT